MNDGPTRLRLLRRRRSGAPRVHALAAVVPSAVTLGAVAMGFAALIFALEGQHTAALRLLFVAALLDLMDGLLARALRATSRFGAELDSLADFFNFGCVLPVVAYFLTRDASGAEGPLLLVAPTLFCICCALRLARFNAEKAEEADAESPTRDWPTRFFFRGMPSPAAAGFVSAPFAAFAAGFIDAGPAFVWAWHIALVAMGLLMITAVPFPSPWVLARLRPRREFVLVAALALTLAAMARPAETILFCCALYAVLYPIIIWSRRRTIRNARAAEERLTGAREDPDAA